MLRCAGCDILFLDTPMSETEEAQFYQTYGKHIVARGVQTADDPAALSAQMLPPARARFEYIGEHFAHGGTVLEVGAAAGSFLSALIERGVAPDALTAVEPSEGHRTYLEQSLCVSAFRDLSAIPAGSRFDVVCMFHVFEHISHPQPFLRQVARLLRRDGRLLIEVPSHTDPLLTLYHSTAFKNFYFQPQHPLIYSPTSITRVLEASEFSVEQIIPYQRYGLGNHLKWILLQAPGDDAPYADRIDHEMNKRYRKALEHMRMTDTLFAVARHAAP